MSTVFEQAVQRDTVPFRHDIVGSFLRPQAIKDARVKFAAGEIDAAQLRKIEDEEIVKLVRKQKEVGLKGVTDGEFRRSWWHLDFFWGLGGVSKKSSDSGYLFHGVESRAETALLTGKVGEGAKHPMVEDFKFLKEAAGGDVVARQTIPAPAQLLFELFRGDNIKTVQEFYPNQQELYTDVANAYRDAILAFYEAGCRNIQLDDCTWGAMSDRQFRAMQAEAGVDIDEMAKSFLYVNNLAIENLPADLAVTTNVCRGNFKSTYAGEGGGYDPIAEVLFGGSDVSAFYLEYDSERAGSFEPLKYVKNQQVVLGLVSSKFGELEDKQQILDRIAEAAKIVDINQLCLSPQCGFASTEEGNILTEEQQWAKLRFIKEIANEVWG
ncbi:5-methyltetrahydropteroyltriglutamate--homocysteine S-methyltransferase [Saccharibacillus sp. CPCC 101409]|uniref:5-methyltetrahydropteroyltriglutamate-- homocysteine S-methyltransferase n=1 Tax=Saccharibacillus sp. CPCC 101409 TaxID=3058041 RepID=UPI002672F8FE|nr:5-methyltetrahydropteroyltriglutamate--homocysteine S-methyltransferase [Saccharibacillus sp. CPCC 101409]MDO3412534.1 5-methyltetrahydropteroyltriglutamate--homocysteine S-methyltransferase [Saccharibacillus sp. CPCC 101409]